MTIVIELVSPQTKCPVKTVMLTGELPIHAPISELSVKAMDAMNVEADMLLERTVRAQPNSSFFARNQIN